MKLMQLFLACIINVFLQPTWAHTFKTEKWKTANGVEVVFYKTMEVPMLDISLAFAAGSAYDGSHYGLSFLTSQLMNQGNAGKDATAIAESLADKGAQFDVDNSLDMVSFNLRSLTRNDALHQAVTTFTQIVNQPDFPDDAFIRAQKQTLMAIEQAQESPEEIANLSFFKNLYHDHPYAYPVMGTKEGVLALNKQQLIDFYKKYYVADNAILVMVGAIGSDEAHRLAEELTQKLPKGTHAAAIPKALPLTAAEQINIKFPSSQTMLRLGQIGIDHQNANYFPLVVGNYILGGGMLISRLSTEVREKRGLTYGVNSQFTPMPGEGPFLISLSTMNNQSAKALKITQNTLRQFVAEGPTQQELDAAKQYLTGSFPLSLSGNKSIATLLLRIAFYHLPDNYLDTYIAHINKVTTEEIKAAFKQQVNPDKLLLISVGQP